MGDFGGFICPFCVIASLQCVLGLAGLALEEESSTSATIVEAGGDTAAPREKVPWLSLFFMANMSWSLGCLSNVLH